MKDRFPVELCSYEKTLYISTGYGSTLKDHGILPANLKLDTADNTMQ